MIKLLIMDCDGVLADGKIVYTEGSLESKSFSTLDGLGLKLLSLAGIKTAVITGRESEALSRRCAELKIDFVCQKVKNKVREAESIIKELSIDWENVAFIGDDWNDFELMKKAGLSAAPQHAFPPIKETVDYVTVRDGGDGAVREFIEYILDKEDLFETAVERFLERLKNSKQ